MIGLLLLAGGGGRLGSCGLEAQDSGSRKRLQDFGLGEGAGPGAGGRKGQEGRGRGLAGGKPLEALFYLPAQEPYEKKDRSNSYHYYSLVKSGKRASRLLCS